ncbi:hypothetical protein OIU76_015107 [Salix suchowensis]|nr:hypothetical protein OIU76_015107 [Salix suchowensis]
MGLNENKKSRIKRAPLPSKEDNSQNLWPDLPQQLVQLIACESTLFRDICYKGVAKSWREESYKCSSRNPTPPWLQLSSHDSKSAEKQPHIFNIAFKHLGFWYWTRRWRFDRYPKLHFLGSSHGIVVAKGHDLWSPVGRSWWSLPPWDSRDPFICAVLSTSPWPYTPKMECFVLVLTGISHPAFVFYQISGGEKKHAWIKEDCTIVDPNCSNPSERRHFMRFTNAIGFKGKFYALSLQGTLAVIENIDSHLRITALGKKRAIPSVSSSHFREFMVESGEEVLLVFLICKTSSSIVDAVEVYRLDTDKLRWIKMESLGDRALFSGSNCCMSVSASKAGCKRNCVYFTHRSGDYCWWVYELDKATISPAQLG